MPFGRWIDLIALFVFAYLYLHNKLLFFKLIKPNFMNQLYTMKNYYCQNK